MSRIAIKICGLSTPETLDAALKGGASHVGFVHFAKSPRHVDGDRLAQLAARVPGHVRKVGVVVNPDNAEIEMLVRVGDLDALQLHGSEAPERLGHFGQFGGRYVAETLMPLILDLEKEYRRAKTDPAFEEEFTTCSPLCRPPQPALLSQNA
jgi:phosphoribosylanthranilate isomerase